MYVNGVSTRRVTEITEQLCGLDIISTQVSRVASMLDGELEKFRNRLLGCYPYVLLDARYEKVRHDGRVIDQAVLIAIGINTEGRREILGVSVKISEAETHWREFLQSLKTRDLHGVELFVSDDHVGLKAARKAVFTAVPWQRKSLLPKHDLHEHLLYALKQKEEMFRYLNDGNYNIDNNPIERQIRPIAIGRNNYLFAGSHDGAYNAAVFYSLINSCKLSKVNPFDYLKDIILKVFSPDYSAKTLLPHNWAISK